jgi:SMI1 / KNR4 family (SUKH-1)
MIFLKPPAGRPCVTPLGIIRQAQARTLIDEDGHVVTLELLPGLSRAEIRDFARRVPCRVPEEITELLAACGGVEGVIDQVDFAGRIPTFEFEGAFPDGLPLASDGFGNFWLVDLHPESTRWGPIYFVCHDAPVILYQSDTLEEFLIELFRMLEPPHESLIDDVHEDRLARVWRTNPGVLSYEQCLGSEDPVLSAFARTLDESFQLIDLRHAKPGDGFSWGRYGPNTQIRRFGTHAVFAYQKRKSIISRLFGGAG